MHLLPLRGNAGALNPHFVSPTAPACPASPIALNAWMPKDARGEQKEACRSGSGNTSLQSASSWTAQLPAFDVVHDPVRPALRCEDIVHNDSSAYYGRGLFLQDGQCIPVRCVVGLSMLYIGWLGAHLPPVAGCWSWLALLTCWLTCLLLILIWRLVLRSLATRQCMEGCTYCPGPDMCWICDSYGWVNTSDGCVRWCV